MVRDSCKNEKVLNRPLLHLTLDNNYYQNPDVSMIYTFKVRLTPTFTQYMLLNASSNSDIESFCFDI